MGLYDLTKRFDNVLIDQRKTNMDLDKENPDELVIFVISFL